MLTIDAQPRSRFLAPIALAMVLAAVALIFTIGANSPAEHANREGTPPAARRPPAFWSVHPGDTYQVISARTGLTVGQLEGLNPTVDPQALVPGERLSLDPPIGWVGEVELTGLPG